MTPRIGDRSGAGYVYSLHTGCEWWSVGFRASTLLTAKPALLDGTVR